MDLYARLAKDLGISHVEAKRKAFVSAYSAQSDLSPVGQLLHEYAKEAMMTNTLSQSEHLKSLGSENTSYVYTGVDKTLLETFPNPMKDIDGIAFATIEIVAPEFTSLCPKTGQPDFATIVVKYVPCDVCVESKSYKLYLGSFRQSGEFHEACVSRIAQDLIALLDPTWLEVEGQFTPRGGIKFWPKVTYHGTNRDLIDNSSF